MTGFKNIIDYWEFINEKQGVITRYDPYNDVDEFGISKIVNDIMDHISQHPDEKYKIAKRLLDSDVHIIYEPLDKGGGYTDEFGNVFVYEKLRKDNYNEVKYIFIHELVHALQIITDKRRPKTLLDKLHRELTIPSINDIVNAKKERDFLYMLYREDLMEISAWSNDAYMLAYEYKMKNPEMNPKIIMGYVLQDVDMNQASYNRVVDFIKTDESSFGIIVNILIGNFSEISNHSTPHFFDERVFKLDVVKRMREDVKEIINMYIEIKEMKDRILQVIMMYMDELKEHKDIIIDSFLTQMDYWFKRAQVKLGKAISLGIDDATINN